jgi:tetratricopeptide (TPR) repeat protein
VSSGFSRFLPSCPAVRVLAGALLIGFTVARARADMGGFHDDAETAAENADNKPQGDGGPSLSEPVSDQFEQLKAIVDAKQWPAALALLDRALASVDPTTYQGGYDTAMLLDTKAKILVEADRMAEAVAPWEEVLRLCKKHPSYFYSQQTNDIIHFLSQIYAQQASNIKVQPGPEHDELMRQQHELFDKAITYMKRWIEGNKKVSQDDELYYADMLFNMASLTTGEGASSLLNQADAEANKGLRLAIHPRDDLYYLVAATAEQKGDLVKAAEYLELLLTRKPESKQYAQQLMSIYLTLAENTKDKFKVRDYQTRAVIAIERAQARGLMNDPKTNLNLVTIYYEMGRFRKATELLSAGLANGGIDPAIRNWQVLAYSYQQLNENGKAVQAYLDAEKLYPDDGSLDYSIGQIYAQQDDLVNAYKYYVVAVHKGHLGTAYPVWVNVAYYAYEMERYDEALAACKEAAALPEASKDTQLPLLRQAIEEKLRDIEHRKTAAADAAAEGT